MGLASMEELLEWDGPWSPDLINLMAVVAEEREAAEAARLFRAVQSAAGSLFSEKAGAAFVKALQEDRNAIRNAQRRARGLEEKRRNVGEVMFAALKKIAALAKGGRRGR